MRYKLNATLGKPISQVIINEDSDKDAAMSAIFIIMDKAYADKSGPWAMGAITLTDPNGNVIQSMAAK
jgi:hypothetical protein